MEPALEASPDKTGTERATVVCPRTKGPQESRAEPNPSRSWPGRELGCYLLAPGERPEPVPAEAAASPELSSSGGWRASSLPAGMETRNQGRGAGLQGNRSGERAGACPPLPHLSVPYIRRDHLPRAAERGCGAQPESRLWGRAAIRRAPSQRLERVMPAPRPGSAGCWAVPSE